LPPKVTHYTSRPDFYNPERMRIFKFISLATLKKLLTGLTVPQQYVCTGLESFSDPLSVYMTTRMAGYCTDVTASHVFVGYQPLCMLLPFDTGDDHHEEVCLNFAAGPFEPDAVWRGFQTGTKCVARLILKYNGSEKFPGNYRLFIGIYGHHSFLGKFHQLFNRVRERFQEKRIDNVSLPGNLHDQVRIAYSVPRIIPLVTVSDGQRMNMFPTDLHGHVGNNFYAGSLRHGGKANSHVEKIGKIAISKMPAAECRFVYTLGKNHMREMKEISSFDVSNTTTPGFQIPVPSLALNFLELKLLRSVDIGIHRIHLYEKVGNVELSSGETLCHIHQYYAQWRIDHGQSFKILLR